MNDCRVTLRSEKVHADISANLLIISHSIGDPSSFEKLNRTIYQAKKLIEEYETVPRAIDPHLRAYIDAISSTYLNLKRNQSSFSVQALINVVSSLVLTLAKVRGYKFVATFFSSNVYLLPEIINYLKVEEVEKNPDEAYLLLLWLSNLVLVPFELNDVADSQAKNIFDVTNRFLSLHTSASKTQIVSLSVLALLLTRVDSTVIFQEYTKNVIETWPELSEQSRLGYLMTFNQILKRASSTEASVFAHGIYNDVILYEMSCQVLTEAKNSNTANLKYLIKVAFKISRFHLNFSNWNVVAEIIDLLMFITTAMGVRLDTSLRECFAKSLTRTVELLLLKADNYAYQLITYVLSRLEADLPEQVYSDNLIIDVDTDMIPLYHTVLLFCGFLALKKALTPRIIPKYLSIAHQTAFLSYRSSGLYQTSQLRDASCFCMWALIRNITFEQFQEIWDAFPQAITNLFLDSIKVAIFDEDLTIRRCGIAVLQEFTGRFGSKFFEFLLQRQERPEVGAFTIHFIELFNTSSVGSLSNSHELIHELVAIGFPPSIFIGQLMTELGQEFCPFNVKVVASRHLPRLLDHEPTTQLAISSVVIAKLHIIEELVAGLLKKNSGSLYGLAELQTANCLESDVVTEVNVGVSQRHFELHQANLEEVESVLNWYSALLKTGIPTPKIFSCILDICRLNPTETLVSILRQVFWLLPTVSVSEFGDMCTQIRLGNHLLARSISDYNFSEVEVSQLAVIVLDKTVEAQTRAYILTSLRGFIAGHTNHQLIQRVVTVLLDDYTTSAQGDVGLLVRYASLEVLAQCGAFANEAKLDVIPKLLRISAETLDKLRVAAFEQLCIFENERSYNGSFGQYMNDYGLFFSDFFEFVVSRSFHKSYCESFWNGVLVCAGATVSGSKLIQLAFKQEMKFLEEEAGNSAEALSTFLHFLRIDSTKSFNHLSNREKKTVTSTLNNFCRLLDGGFQFPDSFNYETLYVRCYNLHINTSNTSRIGLVIRIMQHLSYLEKVPKNLQMKIRQRLLWLAENSPLKTVRLMASEALYETMIELYLENLVISKYERLEEEQLREMICEILPFLRN